MLNRRLIRIKAFKVLYSSVVCGESDLQKVLNEMSMSCRKTLELYHFIFNSALALQNVARTRIELGLQKHLPSYEDLHPNRKFADNTLCGYLLGWEPFIRFGEKNGLFWNDDMMVIARKMYASISAKDYFKEYMANPECSAKEDAALWRRIFEEEYEDNELLEQTLQDMSLYWGDDLAYVLNVILNNVDAFGARGKMFPASVFMKDDDRGFAEELVTHAFTNYGKYIDLITPNLTNFELDRLVTTDVVLIVAGIAEAVHFSQIPIKVTINEYVEISKYYSTSGSSMFVNGLLDKMIQKLSQEGVIVKTGRGLV
ncbi:MAG: transcription antitermination protein NusB [Bacteroidales bacterium]|nr:transcription antitermination protein NusB [Bacteroidales bacterium]